MKTDTKPFDLERALKGEPVVLRDGTKAYIRHRETQIKTNYPLIGYIADGKTEGNIMSWTEDGRCFWYQEDSLSNIAGMWVEPLVFEHWDLLNKDIKYLAKDSNGRWYGYRGKPSKEIDYWFDYSSAKYYSLEALESSLFPECDWESSLIERPENE